MPYRVTEDQLQKIREMAHQGRPFKSADIQSLFGIAEHQARAIVSAAKARNIIVSTNLGSASRFVSPELKAGLVQDFRAQRLARRRDIQRADREKRATDATLYQELDRDPDLPIQTIVSAATAKPLRVSAPNSVFAMGKMA